MRLRASSTRLEVELDRPIRTCDPSSSILVRWWVNGRAIAPHATGQGYITSGGQDVLTRHLRLDLVDAMTAIGARPGDIVGVQALTCPDGWELAGGGQQQKSRDAAEDAWPRLSPRVEFRVR